MVGKKRRHRRSEGDHQESSSELFAQLKHVQDGVVHLGQHGQVDGQAGLAVLRGGRARQPREGVVLLQYKPVCGGKYITILRTRMN